MKKSYSEKELLKLVKKGTLVKRLDKGTNFLIHTQQEMTNYKKSIGAVIKYSRFKKKLKSVYVIYEDFDETIKYFEYPQ